MDNIAKTSKLKFKIEVVLDNDAMLTHYDISRVLGTLANDLCYTYGEKVDMFEGEVGLLKDSNGNHVGTWSVRSEIS